MPDPGGVVVEGHRSLASLRLRGRLLGNPVRVVPLAFLAAIATGTVVLMLPAAREGPYQADPLTALFTATSAVCVTGLFEPFVQGATNGTRGAGLGLSIVRAVVTAHDGEISSTARPTGGMDIAVHLPPALKAPTSG